MSSLIPGLQEEFDPRMDCEIDSGADARIEIPSHPPKSGHDQYSERLDGGVQILEQSRTSRVFEDMLTTYYTPMEVWYARSVIDKVTFTEFFLDPITHETMNRPIDFRLTMCRNILFRPRRLMTHSTS